MQDFLPTFQLPSLTKLSKGKHSRLHTLIMLRGKGSNVRSFASENKITESIAGGFLRLATDSDNSDLVLKFH